MFFLKVKVAYGKNFSSIPNNFAIHQNNRRQGITMKRFLLINLRPESVRYKYDVKLFCRNAGRTYMHIGSFTVNFGFLRSFFRMVYNRGRISCEALFFNLQNFIIIFWCNKIQILNHKKCCFVVAIADLSACHPIASDAKCWIMHTLFIVISTVLRIWKNLLLLGSFSDPMPLRISSNSCPLNLLLFWNHQVEIIFVKRVLSEEVTTWPECKLNPGWSWK